MNESGMEPWFVPVADAARENVVGAGGVDLLGMLGLD